MTAFIFTRFAQSLLVLFIMSLLVFGGVNLVGDPVEMQRKINNGTKHIMEDIEKLSVIVDDLDDGLQLQSTAD